MVRLICFPSPVRSHQDAMLQLAHILHSKGFSITIIHTHFNSPDPSPHPQFTFHPIDDGLSLSGEEAATQGDFNRTIELLIQLNQSCVQPFQEGLAQVLAEEVEEPVACLITDPALPFTRAIADAHNLPRIVFRSDSPLTLPADQSHLKLKNMPVISDKMGAFFNFLSKEINAASGIIWNSFKELEQPQLATIENNYPSELTYVIGPIHKYVLPRVPSVSMVCDRDRACISWLDLQSPKSVVYVSFGTIVAFGEVEFVEMAWGLANSKQPFLWVVRDAENLLEKLPAGFLDMVGVKGHMIVKWAPQIEVLAHPATGCFLTHCGWNSVLECISEGVPMIGFPYFGDHMAAAKYIKDYWKIGEQLEKLEREEIEKAIKRIMVGKEGEEIRERAMYFKEKADDCLKEGGSSFKALDRLVNVGLSLK